MKARDAQLTSLKKQESEHGLMTAQLGSIYDVPIVDDKSTMAATTTAASKHFTDTSGAFT